MKKLFDNKIFAFFTSLIEWVICITLAMLIVLIAFQRFSNQGNFFGYRIYTIATGSMIPTYNIGDTVLIKDMPASEINVGDAVTYIGDAPGVDGLIITHRVEEINIDEEGKYFFHTKGVANNIEDPIVYEYQVLGKVVHKFFFLSIIGIVTTNMALLILFVIIPIALLAGIEITKAVYNKDDDDEIEKIESKDNKTDLKSIRLKKREKHNINEEVHEKKNIDINKIINNIYSDDESENKDFEEIQEKKNIDVDKIVNNVYSNYRIENRDYEYKKYSEEVPEKKNVDVDKIVNNIYSNNRFENNVSEHEKSSDKVEFKKNVEITSNVKRVVNNSSNSNVNVNVYSNKNNVKSTNDNNKKKKYYYKGNNRNKSNNNYYKGKNNNFYYKKKNNKNKQSYNKSFQNNQKNDKM